MKNYIAQKTLEDGTKLRILSWISDMTDPGRRMYRLELQRNPICKSGIPHDWENWDEAHTRMMYDTIQSVQDFDRLRRINE